MSNLHSATGCWNIALLSTVVMAYKSVRMCSAGFDFSDGFSMNEPSVSWYILFCTGYNIDARPCDNFITRKLP
jgi:hypothetical protein